MVPDELGVRFKVAGLAGETDKPWLCFLWADVASCPIECAGALASLINSGFAGVR